MKAADDRLAELIKPQLRRVRSGGIDVMMEVQAARRIGGQTGLPRLAGRWVVLRPVNREDLPSLYGLAMDEAVNFRWRHRGEMPNFEDFAQATMQSSDAQFIAWSRVSNQPVAHLVAYNLNARDRIATIGMAAASATLGKGFTAEAAELFIDYLFAMWDLRKLYAETPDFNTPQFGSRTLFTEEGRLRSHLYYAGRYWDSVILALYREEWDARGADHDKRALAARRLAAVYRV